MIRIALFAFLFTIGAEFAQGQETGSVIWRDGLRFESEHVQLRLGAVLQNDWAFIEENETYRNQSGVIKDGTQFRRARLLFLGTVYGNIDFKAQYEFASGSVSFRDLYIAFTGIPLVGAVRIGQFKEPFGMDQLTSGNNLPFLERSLTDVFSPGRNPGIMISNTALENRMTWALGAFKEGTPVARNSDDANYNVTGRLTALPIADNELLLHVGVAGSRRNPLGEVVRITATPEASLAPRFLDAGLISASAATILAGEVALQTGPLFFQGEIATNRIQIIGADDVSFKSFYVLSGWMITGEKKSYSRKDAVFGSTKPVDNFSPAGGAGAWEILVRFSHLNLESGVVTAGRLEDISFGVGWYPNPVSRVMINYVRAMLLSGAKADILQARFQVAF